MVENLRSALEKIDSGGDTALWDALNLAHECIKTYSAQYTEAKKRIVCLSDGVDTTSKALTWKLCQQFQVIVIRFLAKKTKCANCSTLNRMII